MNDFKIKNKKDALWLIEVSHQGLTEVYKAYKRSSDELQAAAFYHKNIRIANNWLKENILLKKKAKKEMMR